MWVYFLLARAQFVTHLNYLSDFSNEETEARRMSVLPRVPELVLGAGTSNLLTFRPLLFQLHSFWAPLN